MDELRVGYVLELGKSWSDMAKRAKKILVIRRTTDRIVAMYPLTKEGVKQMNQSKRMKEDKARKWLDRLYLAIVPNPLLI